MDRSFLWPSILMLLVSAGSQDVAHSEAAQSQPAEAAKVSSAAAPAVTGAHIVLEVQVTDKSGSPVRGLQKQDFTLLDNNHPQDLTFFYAADRAATASAPAPVELILVVDAINASIQAVADVRNQLRKFLLQNDGKLAQPVTLIFFSGAGKTEMTPPSSDGKALAAICERVEIGQSNSNLAISAAERFDVSVETLTSIAAHQVNRPGRKLMVWIGPGWPYLSVPNLQLGIKQYQWLFDSIVTASTALRQAHITLYEVDPVGVSNAGGSRMGYYHEFLKPVTSPSQVLPGHLGLEVFATQTGGRILKASNDLASEIADCAADADAFYILSFSQPRAEHANEFHALAVNVDKPGVSVRTRTGYYAQP